MVGTQDVLDELAELYSLPESSATAGIGATAVRRDFPTSSRSETLWSTARSHLMAWGEGLLAWHERARQRRALRHLSDDLLGDIGISRAAALAEAQKVWWRA
jgi:uncharacterized protein YjiS (DUF1127 family)